MKRLPKRKADSHKGDYGRALIVAGSPGMTGAAVLAARGALRSGAGLTFLAVPKELVHYVDPATPEVITVPWARIAEVAADAIGVGPGMGVTHQTRQLVFSLVDRATHHRTSRRARRAITLVLDADALNTIARNQAKFKKAADQQLEPQIILTPHPGELSRLLDKSVDFIQRHRKKAARLAAQLFHCLVVLKGHRTVIAHPSGKLHVNLTGNPGMAGGGTGDVLTGLIAGLAAQGLSPWEAAVAGVHLHGLAGDLAAAEKGEYGLTASDLVEKIPYAIRKNS